MLSSSFKIKQCISNSCKKKNCLTVQDNSCNIENTPYTTNSYIRNKNVDSLRNIFDATRLHNNYIECIPYQKYFPQSPSYIKYF